MIKIFLLVLWALTSASGEESRIECPEDNLSYGVWFQEVYNVLSWEDCGRICKLTSNCNFWTWGKAEADPNECFLYETDTGIYYNDNYISGERGCPEENCD